MERERIDVLVIGAGVVGLAVARALALEGREVLICERNGAIGEETSSRHSEVIHAGIYYPPGSLKARLCVEGKRLLYAYAAERGIGHERCGKLIVAASEEERDGLERIAANAAACGVEEIVPLGATEARSFEPELACVAALLSPTTGIVDSHALMLSLLGDAEDRGATLALGTEIVSIDPGARPIARCDGLELEADLVVNAAGHGAPALAAGRGGPIGHRCKGSYFKLAGRSPFRRLIYPLPNRAGLGVHATIDLDRRCRFGPDVEWLAAEQPVDYAVDPTRAQSFAEAIARYWPGLDPARLEPDYAGVRPKIAPEGAPAADFAIRARDGLVDLFGIESPGLTASLAIGARVAALAGRASP